MIVRLGPRLRRIERAVCGWSRRGHQNRTLQRKCAGRAGTGARLPNGSSMKVVAVKGLTSPQPYVMVVGRGVVQRGMPKLTPPHTPSTPWATSSPTTSTASALDDPPTVQAPLRFPPPTVFSAKHSSTHPLPITASLCQSNCSQGFTLSAAKPRTPDLPR